MTAIGRPGSRLYWAAQPEGPEIAFQAPHRGLPALGLALALAAGLGAPRARAEEPAPAPAPREVELEDLLRLPSGLDYQMELRGGASRDEWRRRFQEARANLAAAQKALQESLSELENRDDAGSWKMAPPGLGQLQQQQQSPSNPAGQTDAAAPLDFALTSSIRRQKDEVKRAERSLRDLEVEANLAAVPPAWRE